MVDQQKIERAVSLILEALGEDPEREGLLGTPRRVAEMYSDFFSGLAKDPASDLATGFDEGDTGVVILRDIPFFSICEHHFLPFYGTAAVGYVPDGRVVGVSKLARALDVLARRPQLQERLTNQFVDTIYQTVRPKGVVAVISAEHMCLTLRGAQKPGSKMVTSASRGTLESQPDLRREFFQLM